MWQNVYREMSKKSLLNILCRQVLSLNMRRTERVFDDVELLGTLVLLIIQPLKVFFFWEVTSFSYLQGVQKKSVICV